LQEKQSSPNSPRVFSVIGKKRNKNIDINVSQKIFYVTLEFTHPKAKLEHPVVGRFGAGGGLLVKTLIHKINSLTTGAQIFCKFYSFLINR